MSKHTRVAGGTVTAPDDDLKGYSAVVVVYDVTDDYETRFQPGVFARSLGERMPQNTWGHSWSDVIGRMDDVLEDSDARLRAHFRLDLDMIPGTDRPAVPRAYQAQAQLRSGTLTDVSVGFSREQSVLGGDDRIEFIRAELDEVGLVLRGAVPGAEVDGLRHRRVSVDELAKLAQRIEAGTLTEAEALRAIQLIERAGEQPPAPPAEQQEIEEASAELEEALAEVADLLP